MFDKMSKRAYSNTFPTLPTEQYIPISNWMSDLPPVTKKPRAIHTRLRGNINKQHQRHRPQQHEKQPNEQQSQPPSENLKSLIDDGLPKGRDFPENHKALNNFAENNSPLTKDPQYVKSLDYSLRTESNKLCLSEHYIIQNKVTGRKISVPSSVIPVIPDFSLVQSLNLRLRN